ncbi:MAG: SIR2 family protein [Chromatiales bacterium]|jgi:hypothetical protein
MTDRRTIQALTQVLKDGFNLEELQELCDRLEVDAEDLPPTKAPLLNALLKYLDRHNRIPDLLELGRTHRSELDWPQLPGERLTALKQAIGRQDSEEVDEIFPELITYIKQLEKQGISDSDEKLLNTLELFGEGDMPGAKLVRIWNKERAKQQASVDQELDYGDLADRLQHGEIVLFLGARYSHTLVENLAQAARYEEFQGTLSEICEYMEGDGRQTLLRKVSEIQNRELAAEDGVHQALYQLLSEINQPLLLISATYDSALQESFRARHKPFKVISHTQAAGSSATATQTAGNLLIQEGAADTPRLYTAEQLSDLAPLENGFSVIYKIRGCFRFIEATPSTDTLTLSERDYFRFAKEFDKLMPDYLAAQLKGRSLWFIGHYPDTWEERLLIQVVHEKAPVSTLAIHPGAKPFAEAYWKARSIDLCRLEPEAFIEKLKENLHD